MKTYTIKLNTFEKVKDFSNKISSVIGDIDLISGKYVIDAKSIMGIFSLDLSKPINMRVISDDSNSLEKLDALAKEFAA